MKISDLDKEYDKLQLEYGAKELAYRVLSQK